MTLSPRLSALVLAAAFLASPPAARSQDGPATPTDADRAALEACLSEAVEAGTEKILCVGTVSDACLEEPGNESTAMMTACLDRETTLWDERLNETYGALMDRLGPEQADALKQAQRAWITMRDETCAYEASLWQGGTGAGPAAVNCFLRETGWRALFLDDTRAFAEGE
jgi:uncharacterized protein YecT (DUF1311 family)